MLEALPQMIIVRVKSFPNRPVANFSPFRIVLEAVIALATHVTLLWRSCTRCFVLTHTYRPQVFIFCEVFTYARMRDCLLL